MQLRVRCRKFHGVSRLDKGLHGNVCFIAPLTFLERDRFRQAVHISQSCDAPGIVLHRVPFALVVFRCSLSAWGTVLS
jgi:hypothetical protein